MDWPGPSARVSGNPLRILEGLAADYGDFARYATNFGDTYLVNDPDGVREILYDPEMHPRTDLMRPMLGDGLIQSEGALWHSQRRVYQPHFHPHTMDGYLAVMVEETNTMLGRWESTVGDGGTLSASVEMKRLSLPISMRTMVGGTFTEEEEAELCTATERIGEFLGVLGNPMADTITPQLGRGMRGSLDFLNATIGRLLAKRKAEGTRSPNLMSMLLQATDPRTGQALGDAQLRDETATILVGGHETTASLLMWMWYAVGRRPEVEAKLHEEWDRVLGDRNPSMEDVGKLGYTRATVQEVLRLYPPVWIITRKIAENTSVCGRPLPKGSNALVSAWTLHRHPRLWDAPLEFRPERFEPEAAKTRHRHAWFPFGVGPHTCVGQHFAQLEAVVVLAMVGRRWRLVPTTESEPVPLISLRAADGLPTRLERRAR